MKRNCIHCSSDAPGKTVNGKRYCQMCGLPKRKSGDRGDIISRDECVNGHRRAFLGVGEMSDAEIDHHINMLGRDKYASVSGGLSGAVYHEMAGV